MAPCGWRCRRPGNEGIYIQYMCANTSAGDMPDVSLRHAAFTPPLFGMLVK